VVRLGRLVQRPFFMLQCSFKEIKMNVKEMVDLIFAIDLAIQAIESGGDDEKRRWNPEYNWQTMNDALRCLKEIRGGQTL
jgi:hypothetical protein